MGNQNASKALNVTNKDSNMTSFLPGNITDDGSNCDTTHTLANTSNMGNLLNITTSSEMPRPMADTYIVSTLDPIDNICIHQEGDVSSQMKPYPTPPKRKWSQRTASGKRATNWSTLTNQGANLQESLKSRLLQLECHFTWNLKSELIDVGDYMERMYDEISFAQMKSVYHCYNCLAFASHLKQNYEEALTHLQKAEESIVKNYANDIDRHSIVTLGNFAWVYYYMDRTAESQSYLQKVQNVCKTSGSPSLYAIPLAEVYGEKGWTLLTFCKIYYAEAAECFEKALKENPRDPESNSGYAVALHRLETPAYVKCTPEESKSLPQLRQALAINPNDTLCMVLLGLKLQDFGKQTQGVEYIEQALQKSPDVPHVIRYAAKFFRKYGSVDRSIELLENALAKTPNSAFLHHQVGMSYKKKICYNPLRISNAVRKSIYHFEKAVELNPQFIYALLDLANLYKKIQNYEKVEACFKRLYDIPSCTPENLQDIHVQYGLFLLENKKSESNAVVYFKEGCKIKNPSRSRDMCFRNLRNIAHRRLSINSNDSSAHGILGFVHALQCDSDNEDYLDALSELQFFT
ncbi:interferon-induced protein with tetratricopeptide repeats 1-like [Protopterus annectens]|uniref:interferon-induced protein with tetratricopeptide repeats 1-like n=1 Tax=Protopterus annectens TaxID=7888 RepID=UPI001CFA5434|nr:interferon-induced protein with tetratricopeptide repeats 1-like [Protopterus annectens]